MSRLFVLVALFGLSVFAGIAAWMHMETRAQESFAPARARVVESGVKSYTGVCDGRDCTRYRPHVRYKYDFGGRHYESSEIGGVGMTSIDRADAEREVAPFPVGATVTAFVDPTRPSNAVLRPGMPAWASAIFIGAGIAWASIWLALGWIFRRRDAPA